MRRFAGHAAACQVGDEAIALALLPAVDEDVVAGDGVDPGRVALADVDECNGHGGRVGVDGEREEKEGEDDERQSLHDILLPCPSRLRLAAPVDEPPAGGRLRTEGRSAPSAC